MRTKVAKELKTMRVLSLFLVFVMLITTQGFTSIARTVSENEANGENTEQTNTEQTNVEQINTEETNAERTNAEQTNTEQTNAEQTNVEQTNAEQIKVEETDAGQPEKQSIETEEAAEGNSISENNVQAGAGTPANPVHHHNEADGTQDTTTWSYVYFGSYPQSEVTDTNTINAIEAAIAKNASGNDAYIGERADNGTDVWVNGTKYRRIS